MNPWEFWIDVGGTFTDCIARSPDDRLVTCKVLSSGVTKGTVSEVHGPVRFSDPGRSGDPPKFWTGYHLRLLDRSGQPVFSTTVASFDRNGGALTTAALLPENLEPDTVYELSSGEEAPLVAIRKILGLRLEQPIPPVSVRLGTTRGTNALLTRRGARTAFVTTKGFADILLIANQDRPRLFDLEIRKPEPLFEHVVEIDARMDPEGQIVRELDETAARAQLMALRETSVESIAICLLHSFANPAHEQTVERLARDAGFAEISTSSRLSPLIKIVSRGDTTVVDAYLNPILRQYVQTLRQSLGDSRLRLMTSAGGLVDADRFVGKDSILSGPAGGVIGFSRVGERAGFSKSIGFDMGGTSTDVSRYDGRYELEFETKKAGVRVVAPMLSIETVAAGGGSICEFDGVKLVVGPNSAGADPGPACYGRGGPLTVTDVNLFLGRIVAARFPFPLDRAAVAARLENLCERIAASSAGTHYAAAELAEGFVRVANANMVRAIRNISVARGYDPRDYALVTFGGAGAQHACAISRELGMRQILSHPFAGLLSAYGIGLADVRRFREQAVLRPCTREQLAAIEPLFVDLAAQARDEVAAEGIPDAAIEPARRSLDLRYRGIEATINVPQPADGDYITRYEALHERLYSYKHSGREIEIVAARVEVVGRMPDPPDEVATPGRRRPEPVEMTEAWFDGGWRQTPVFLREQLRAGDQIAGPAVLCEPTSTIVVESGFDAEILPRGEVLLTDTSFSPFPPGGGRAGDGDGGGKPRLTPHCTLTPDPSPIKGEGRSECASDADPVQLEIFNNLFASIAEQMGITLQRTSFSTNVKERLDFSCAIFDPEGGLVVNAPHIPVHLGAMGETVRRIIADNPLIRPGDVFVTNDPYRGGSHLPDVTVVTPVFADCGLSSDGAPSELASSVVSIPQSPPLFFTASRAHHAEIGGIVPGSMPPFSKNLAEEGVLIRNFKLVDAGKSREADLEQLLLSGPYPTRSVRDNLADVAAQVAANNSGAARLRELCERYTLPVVQAYMRHIQQAAERKMRMALAAIPDGAYRFVDHLDNGSPIAVEITIRGDQAVVDFTGTGPVIRPPAHSPPLQEGAGGVALQESGVRNQRSEIRSQRPEASSRTPPLSKGGSGGVAPHESDALASEQVTSNVQLSTSNIQSLNVQRWKLEVGRSSFEGSPGGYNLNANRAIVTAATLYVFRCLIKADIPLNGGVLAPVKIVLPECLLNPPEHDDPAQCAAIVGGNVETSQRVVDVLLGALEVAAASQGTMNNLTFGDDTFGYYETICGGSGATPHAAGADAVHTHMTNTRLTDPEVLERRYPVRLLEFSIRRNSGGRPTSPPLRKGGSGGVAPHESDALPANNRTSNIEHRTSNVEAFDVQRSTFDVRSSETTPPVVGDQNPDMHRGGDGVLRRLEFLKPLRVSILSERRGNYVPFGLHGAPAGAPGVNLLLRAGEIEPVDLGGKAQIDVQPGDVLTIATPGGGACRAG